MENRSEMHTIIALPEKEESVVGVACDGNQIIYSPVLLKEIRREVNLMLISKHETLAISRVARSWKVQATS